MTSFLIGYPDIPQAATTITKSHTEDSSFPQVNTISGGRGLWHQVSTATADDTYVEYDLGAATTKSSAYLAIQRANLARKRYANKIKLTGSSASAFTPTSIAGCKLWLDATRGITKDGSNLVSQWDDQSGQGNHATQSGSNRPTWVAPTSGINGNAYINFASASTKYMVANAAASPFTGSDKAFTVSTAYRKTTNSGTQNYFVFGRSSSTTPVHQLYDNGSAYAFFRRDDASSSANSSGGTVNTSTHVVTVVFSGTALSLWVDGTLTINNAAANVGTMTLNTVGIGAWSTTSALQPFNGDICEMVLHDTALGTSDRQALEEYLAAKWTRTAQVSDTAFDTATLRGPRAEDYISAFSASTAYRYWWLQYGASAASKYPRSKDYFGSWFDFGREPIYPAEQSRVGNANQREAAYMFDLTWVGISNTLVASFIDSIAKYKDINPVVLYDSADAVLNGHRTMHAWVREIEITADVYNQNTVRVRFEEAL